MILGKVVLLPLPFDDLSATKVRAALCLTEPLGPHRHVIVAFITSRIPLDLLHSDLVLDSNHPDFSATGLRVSSAPRLHRMITVSTSLFKRELGELSPAIQAEVSERLRKLFGL